MITNTASRLAFENALAYEDYVKTGTADQQTSWRRVHERVRLTPPQQIMLAGFTRHIPLLVLSGTWCGDCAQQVPMLDHLAKASNGRLDLRVVDRDSVRELHEQVRICGGFRVPTALFLNEDFEFLGIAGDKTLSRLRAIAARSIGAACEVPGASSPDGEMAATLDDWAREAERAHLIARLSPRLRERHGD